jgi:lysophospholipase L1-like esterase
MVCRIFVAGLAAMASLGLSVASQAQGVQIVTFGDSGPAGNGVEQAEAYPAQLQAALRAQGIQATVQNISVSGDKTADGLARVGKVPATAKLVIVEFGSNDLRANVPDATRNANMVAIVQRLQANGAKVIVLGTRGIDYSPVAQATGAVAITYPPSFRNYIQSGTGRHFSAQGHKATVDLIMPNVLAATK